MNTKAKNTELASFNFVFQLSRTIIFEVNYYRLGDNGDKYFSTSAAAFNRPKTDFNQCGQAQDTLLKGFTAAMAFYKKFDPLHIKDLTAAQHAEVLAGIEALKAKYNFIQRDGDYGINFSDSRALSIQTPKRLVKAVA